MTSILMDRKTGDICLSETNNTIQIDNKNAFEQIILGVLHCDLGSELMSPFYGFDLKTAIREGYRQDSEMFIESLIVQALNPEYERLISKLDYIKAEKEGREMKVIIQVSSILGETAAIGSVLNEL